MEDFQTEEQQVEAIKKFWHNNGNYIIAGIVIGLGSFIGFNKYQESQSEQAMVTTEAFIEFQNKTAENPENLSTAAETFLSQHGQSSYASLAEFALAKSAVEKKDWANAEKHLNAALTQAANKSIAAVATFRLAKVQIQSEQIDKALATLNSELPASFKGNVEELKGDAYLLQGKTELARSAYQAALDAQTLGNNPSLQMKLDDLSVAISLN